MAQGISKTLFGTEDVLGMWSPWEVPKVKLAELETQPRRRQEGCSPPCMPPGMEDEILSHGCSLSQDQITLFIMLLYSCSLGISIQFFIQGNISNKSRGSLVIKLWSAWEVGDNLWVVVWLLLHACRSGTLNEPLLHSCWWGSADEGGKLTSLQ